MKKAYRYILKSFAGPMVLAFFIVLFILLMQMLWRYIDELVGKGLETSVIVEFMFWSVITLIPMTLPLSMLFASIMTMGNLGGNNELLALKSAGFSLTKMLRPMFVVAFSITIFAFYVSDYLMPEANLQIQSLFWDIKNKRPDANIIPGVFCAIDDNVIKVDSKDPKTNKMTGILLYQHPEGKGNVELITADSGYIKSSKDNMEITLYHGVSYEDESYNNFTYPQNRFTFQKRTFDKHSFVVDLSKTKMKRTDIELFKGHYIMMKSAELNKVVDSLVIVSKQNVEDFWHTYADIQTFDNNIEIDTALKMIDKKPVKEINTDSVYSQFDRRQKLEAISYAVNKLQNSIQSIRMSVSEVVFNRENIRKADVEWHSKYAMSIACFIFFLVGAPLGAIIRKGGLGMPTIASLLLFIFYYILMTIFRKMAIQGVYPVAVAMWIPNAVYLPLGIFLLYKSTTDSALFDGDMYKRFFKRMLRIDDKTSYFAPTEISKNIGNNEEIEKMLQSFTLQTNNMLEKTKSKHTKFADVESFYNNYDKLLGQLWGIQNEGLNEKLKDYPELELKLFKTKIPILAQLTNRLLFKKLEKINKTNLHVDYIIKKIKW